MEAEGVTVLTSNLGMGTGRQDLGRRSLAHSMTYAESNIHVKSVTGTATVLWEFLELRSKSAWLKEAPPPVGKEAQV